MADIITHLIPPAASDGAATPGPLEQKWKDMGDGSYALVVAVDASSLASTVTTDGDTVLGDGSVGDPITTDGGIGAPYWIYFSCRSVGNAPTQYFPIALAGSIGSGGVTTQDPTNTADGGGWAASFALQLPKGELSNLRMAGANGPGIGETITFSVRLNAADPASGLSIAFTGDAAPTSGADNVNVVVVPEDGYVALKVIMTGGASNGGYTGRILFTPKP